MKLQEQMLLILEELKAIRTELQKTKVESGFYTTEEAIIKIGYKSRAKAGASILRELKKQGMIENLGTNKWDKSDIERIAPKIDREIFFRSDDNYKLIKTKKAA